VEPPRFVIRLGVLDGFKLENGIELNNNRSKK